MQKSEMKLSNRQLYDYTDIDRGEIKLIRIGHALWTMLFREKRGKSYPLCEIRAFEEAIQTIVRLKKEYRSEFEVKRAIKSAKVWEHFARSI